MPAVEAKDVNSPSMADGSVTSSTTFRRTFTSQMKGVWKIVGDVPGFRTSLSADTLVSKRKGDIETLSVTFTRTRGTRWPSGPRAR